MGRYKIKSLLILLIIILSINQVYTQTKFAVIGDYGEAGSDEEAVANLINSWNVDFIITTGDNSYNSTPIDQNIGQYYSDWIGNYSGSYGNGSSTNKFFPSLGNHDYDDGGGLSAYLNYFTLPGINGNSSDNERYYDYIINNIHFFAVNSCGDEPDGIDGSSVQANWLQNQMTNSTAKWKIVYDHHPPYSSGDHGSYSSLRWNFLQWGADAVLSGHDHSYERLEVDGLTYFVNGLGGRSIYNFGNPLPESQLRYNGDFGAQKVTVSENEMTFEFYNINGDLIDSWTLQQSSPDIAPPQLQAAEINYPTQVTLYFSESLESQSAQNATNYSIDNGISVLSVALSNNNRDVILTTTEHSTNQQYTVTVRNVTDLAGNSISSQANSAQYLLEADTIPPQLMSAFAIAPTQVTLFFSEALDSQSAQNVSNYNINTGVSVIEAALNSNNTDVTLTTSAHEINQTYTVTVSNVTDLSGNVISQNNNSADYQLIIVTEPVFPVDLFSTPESEKTVTVDLSLQGNIPDFLTFHLIAFDADHGGIDPPEGHAFINGNGPLELFPGATQANGDGQTNSFTFSILSSWLYNGENELRFVRLYSTGYRIDSAFVIVDGSTGVIKTDNIPLEFSLAQNYPNPFNPTTNISFLLPKDSKVKITVSNLLGEQIAELVNSEFVSGSHTISFDADGLPSGIYFYTMSVENFMVSRKMVILR